MLREIDFLLFFVALACFIRFLYYQAVIILKIGRPFNKEDSKNFGPFWYGSMEKKKRFTRFINGEEYLELKQNWLQSIVFVFVSYATLFVWSAVLRKLFV